MRWECFDHDQGRIRWTPQFGKDLERGEAASEVELPRLRVVHITRRRSESLDLQESHSLRDEPPLGVVEQASPESLISMAGSNRDTVNFPRFSKVLTNSQECDQTIGLFQGEGGMGF